MKKITTLLLLGTIAFPGWAQEKENQDTTRIKIGKTKILIIGNDEIGFESDTVAAETTGEKDQRNKHWAGLELGVNGYATPSHTLNPPPDFDFLELDYSRSVNFNFNFLEKDIRIIKEYAKIITGLGLAFNNYAFDNNITLLPRMDSISAYTDTTVMFDKNKLKTAFITLPVLLAFNTSQDPKRAFHIVAGLVFGYKISSKTKQKYDIGDERYKDKVRASYNLLPYRYSARVGIGYGNFNLYATYALSSLFEKNEGPELHPFTLGVSIMGI